MVKPKSNQSSFRRVITFLPKKAVRAAHKAHRSVVAKPHAKLLAKGKTYATWHAKKHHHKVHLGIAAVWTMIAIVGALGLTNIAKAFDTFTQSDWSGGVGASTVDEYVSKDNIVTSNAGELSLDSGIISNWCSTADCDNNWTKRKKLVITNSGVSRTDYQVELTIPYETDMQTDFEDLRFVNQAGDTQYPFVYKHVNASTSTVMLVKLPTLASGLNTLYMYYGNASAPQRQDYDGTFDWWDSFSGAAGDLNPAKWDTTGQTGVGIDGNDNMVLDGTNAGGVNIFPANGGIDRNDPAVYEAFVGVSALGNNNSCAIDGSYFSLGLYASNISGNDRHSVNFVCNQGQDSWNLVGGSETVDGGSLYAQETVPGFSSMGFAPSGGGTYRVGLNGSNPVMQYESGPANWVDFPAGALQQGSLSPLQYSLWIGGPGVEAVIGQMVRYKIGANYSTNFGIEETLGGKVGSIYSGFFDLGLDYAEVSFSDVQITTSGTGGQAAIKVLASDDQLYSVGEFEWCGQNLNGEQISICNPGQRYVAYQVVMSAEAGSNFRVEEVSLNYILDVTAPTNPTSVTMTEGPGGQVIANGGFTNLRTLPAEIGGTVNKPYFEWSGAADNVGGAGVLGYCIYFGTDNSADPLTSKGAITDNSPLDTGGACPYALTGTNLDLANVGLSIDLTQYAVVDANYYLRIRAIDAVYNPSVDTEEFELKLDTTPPALFSPVIAPGTRQGPGLEITWPTTLGGMLPLPTDIASEVFGGPPANPSGVAGIAYCISDTAGAFAGHCIADPNAAVWYGANGQAPGSILDLGSGGLSLANASTGYFNADLSPNPAVDFNGPNVAYIVVVDNAGNFTNTSASGFSQANNKVVEFNNTPPSAPQNLVATPTTNNANSFAFNWDAPSDLVGLTQNANYCWSANVLPDANNCTFAGVGVESLSADAYATQPGLNTMYVVAKDEAGNIDYANYASATFTANTSAPGAPRNLEVIDASNKATSTWKLALSWDVPLLSGSGVDKYKIFRSQDDITYTEIGSTTATSFVDAGLNQVEYFYKIKACDNANNCGLYSDMDSLMPTGRYTDPANLVSGPSVVNIKTRSAGIQWSTDRVSDTKVAYGTSSNNYQAAQAYQAAQVTSHSIELTNLQPGTTYYYRARWTDDDGNTGQSAELQFKTQPAPVVSDAAISNINLSSATLGFTTQAATKAKIYYGTSTAFGSLATVNTSTDLSSYTTQLSNLADGTKYFYRINTVDSSGYEYDGSVASFTTLPRPRIENLVRAQIEGEPSSTQKITWTTNVPASSEVAYSPTGTPQKVAVTSDLKTEHEMIIRGLSDDTQYTWIARSRDALGNVAVSDPQEFRTALDTRPPKAFDINTESSIRGTGAEARGQIIVTWKTDEPSTSQVSYGVGAGSSATTKTAEDARLTTDHIVIISDLSTSSVYNVQAISADKAGNKVVSTDQSVVVGRGTDNILSIIFGALQKIFGVEL